MPEIRFGAGDNMDSVMLGATQIEEARIGQVLVWRNNAVPTISVTGPVVGTAGASNVNIDVVANINNVIIFDYADDDPLDTVTTLTVTDPTGATVAVTGFTTGLNSGTGVEFVIDGATLFPMIQDYTTDNVFTITATDSRGGAGVTTITVEAATFAMPTLTVSGEGGTAVVSRTLTGTAVTAASAPAGSFTVVTVITGDTAPPPLTAMELSAITADVLTIDFNGDTCSASNVEQTVEASFRATTWDPLSMTSSTSVVEGATATFNGSSTTAVTWTAPAGASVTDGGERVTVVNCAGTTTSDTYSSTGSIVRSVPVNDSYFLTGTALTATIGTVSGAVDFTQTDRGDMDNIHGETISQSTGVMTGTVLTRNDPQDTDIVITFPTMYAAGGGDVTVSATFTGIGSQIASTHANDNHILRIRVWEQAAMGAATGAEITDQTATISGTDARLTGGTLTNDFTIPATTAPFVSVQILALYHWADPDALVQPDPVFGADLGNITAVEMIPDWPVV